MLHYNDIVIRYTSGVAISLGILGTTYCDLGKLSKAEQLLQKSVDINRKVNGPEHIGMGIAQTLLGRVERLAGKLQSARKTLESALEIKEGVHGLDHPGELLNSASTTNLSVVVKTCIIILS